MACFFISLSAIKSPVSVLEEIRSLGCSLAEFSRRTEGIAVSTLRRLEKEPERVRSSTSAKVRIALQKLREERGLKAS